MTSSSNEKLKIAIISQPEYFRFCYEDELNIFGDVREYPLHSGMSAADYSNLINFNADINIFFRPELISIDVLNRLRGIKVALSSEPFPRYIDGKLNYTKDSIFRYLSFRAIRYLPYDYVFHYDESSLNFIQSDGLFLSGAFVFPVATKTYIPTPAVPNWDFFFIGRSTSHREDYFGSLKHHFHFLHICHGIAGKALVDYINRSKICLNIHAEAEISWEPRMQMLLSCGAFVISEKITPNKFLRPGVDYIEVGSPREAYTASEYFLKHEEERLRIAQSARDTIVELLNAEHSFRMLITGILNKSSPRFDAKKPRMSIHLIDKAVQIFRVARKRMTLI
ncbi:glycosyltransferase [Nitrosovibrio tenuis]|uniref:Glycosyl transferases group 1 n=1 Tax=Nitrosovibrio tenuis TaxID=1233 RepID=A0A1H7GCB9_9PROT|nr:glycosyltransferase [Nitrosovibrio tenuis]SEK35769.1 Glycosyl transferases group 1 [Nitrosovibrio tenuis]